MGTTKKTLESTWVKLTFIPIYHSISGYWSHWIKRRIYNLLSYFQTPPKKSLNMDGFIDCLDKEKWMEVSAAELTGKFEEYDINRKHVQVDDTTMQYGLTNDNSDLKTVTIEGILKGKDPLCPNKQNLNKCEFRLSEDGTKVTGLNLDDCDCAVLK